MWSSVWSEREQGRCEDKRRNSLDYWSLESSGSAVRGGRSFWWRALRKHFNRVFLTYIYIYKWLMNKLLTWSIHPGAHSRRACQSQLTAFATRLQCCYQTSATERPPLGWPSDCHTSLGVCHTYSKQRSGLPWRKAKAPLRPRDFRTRHKGIGTPTLMSFSRVVWEGHASFKCKREN